MEVEEGGRRMDEGWRCVGGVGRRYLCVEANGDERQTEVGLAG